VVGGSRAHWGPSYQVTKDEDLTASGPTLRRNKDSEVSRAEERNFKYNCRTYTGTHALTSHACIHGGH
jgi:hypothetical protein